LYAHVPLFQLKGTSALWLCQYSRTTFYWAWVAIHVGQEIVREKILWGQGKVRELYSESGKIEIFYSIDLLVSKAERKFCGHCHLGDDFC